MFPADTAQLSALSKSRGYVRTRITKTINEVNDRLVTLTELDRPRFIDKITALKTELDERNKQIFTLTLSIETDDTKVDAEVEAVNNYDDQIVDCLFNLKNHNEPPHNNATNDQEVGTNTLRQQQLQLPKINLPTYNNDKMQSFHKFITSFGSIVNKFQISPYEKFCLLKQQLSKAPLALVDSLSVNQQSKI